MTSVLVALVVGIAGCSGSATGDPEDGGESEAGEQDAAPSDARRDGTLPGEGGDFSPCETGADCRSAICVDLGQGKVCSRSCGDDDPCPAPFSCTAVDGFELTTHVCLCDAAPETCNDLDDDCDGQVDEDLDDCCVPAPETCNGLDDDCDEETPDGADDPRVGGSCGAGGAGTSSCTAGGLVCTGAAPPEVGTCDAFDTDCTGVTYVDADATGANDGTSWEDAFTDLQAALDLGTTCQIWIAEGVYVPTRRRDAGDPRTASFALPAFAQLYGGFRGDEATLGARDIATHETVLSGEIGTSALDDNLFTLVSASGVAALSIDGLTLTRASFDPGAFVSTPGATAIQLGQSGSQLACRDSRITGNRGRGFNATVRIAGCATVERCEFSENSTFDTGGVADGTPGLMFTGSTLHVVGSLFRENRTTGACGAGYFAATESIVVEDTRFIGNEADSGVSAFQMLGGQSRVTDCEFVDGRTRAAIQVTSALSLENTNVVVSGTLFEHNVARSGAGALIGKGGAINVFPAATGDARSISISHCTFVGNEAEEGAAIYAYDQSLDIATSLFSGNRSGAGATAHFHGEDADTPLSWRIASSTFANNESTGAISGAALEVGPSSAPATLRIEGSILWSDGDGETGATGSGATLAIERCDIDGWTSGGTSFSSDPMFLDADGPDGMVGTRDDDLRLGAGSACIDAADATLLPADVSDIDDDDDVTETTPLDLDGRARATDDPRTDTGTGAPTYVDLGCYER